MRLIDPVMSPLVKCNPVRNNARLHRFEMDTPAGVAVADYRIAGNLMTIFYTEVPFPLRGRGYGYHLVCGALQEVRRLNLKVEPECRFVREVINNRPEFNDLISAREASRSSGGIQ
jgi:predicted GNAT family acetyltransferase